MSVTNEIHTLIEQLYTAELMLKTLHVHPREYDGTMLYDKESHTLERIAKHPDITQAELAEMMFCTKSATSMIVDKLIEKGLVLRQRRDEDRRSYILVLTAKGKSVNAAHEAYDLNFSKLTADSLDIDEATLRQTNECLEHLTSFYREFRKERSQRIEK